MPRAVKRLGRRLRLSPQAGRRIWNPASTMNQYSSPLLTLKASGGAAEDNVPGRRSDPDQVSPHFALCFAHQLLGPNIVQVKHEQSLFRCEEEPRTAAEGALERQHLAVTVHGLKLLYVHRGE